MATKTCIVLGGTGMMGRIVVQDLYATAKASIIIADRNAQKLADAKKLYRSPRVQTALVDVTDHRALVRVLRKGNIVLNCVNYEHNLRVMEAALEADTHYLDLGGLYHMTNRQKHLHEAFEGERLTAILGCGSTPGITNVLAGFGAELLDRVTAIDVKVGGRTLGKSHGGFAVPYAIQTIVDEFTKRPAVYRAGRMRFVRPLSGRIVARFPRPIGGVPMFYSLHSELASFPESFGHRGLRAASFRVGFDPAFVRRLRALIREGPAAISAAAAASAPPKKVRDVEVLRVELHGRRKKARGILTAECLARSRRGVAAGDIDTASPISIMAQMVLDGRICACGVVPPERCVPPQEFFRELRRRGMRVSWRWRAKK